MTNDEIVEFNEKINFYAKTQRCGQAHYNALRDVRPDIAGMIVNTDKDPFYDDSRLPVFLNFISEFIK